MKKPEITIQDGWHVFDEGDRQFIEAKSGDGIVPIAICQTHDTKQSKANAQAISAVPNAVDDYKSLLHAIENNKTDRGAVILGDKLEKSIKATAKKMGFKE